LIDQAEQRLSAFASSTATSGLEVTAEVLIGGPSQAIVERAAAPDVDVIVMGTHGRAGITHFLIGSVAERVVRYAPCPVLVARERRIADVSKVPATASEAMPA
jgi:nucleotide-binding universal stress UspA family protein